MDQITQEEDMSIQTERETSLPLPPKRPRINGGEGTFGFSELLTFRQTLLTGNSGTTVGLRYTEVYESPQDHPEDIILNVNFFAQVRGSRAENTHSGSTEVCRATAEVHPALHVQRPCADTDEQSSCLGADTQGALAKSHTLKDSCMFAIPEWQRLWKSLKGNPPGGCSVPPSNGVDGRHAQKTISQVQDVSLTSSDVEVKCQPDYMYEEVLHAAGGITPIQSADVERCNQSAMQLSSTEIVFSEEEEVESAENDPTYPKGVKNERTKTVMQICEKGVDCEGETKDRFNEDCDGNDGYAAGCDVVSGRAGPDVVRGAKGQSAGGQMKAQPQSETAHHAAETPMPARISQEAAEGDNDASPFSVIDPVIWSETVREAEENRCNSESSAGVGLSPSVTACETQLHRQPAPDVGLTPNISGSDVYLNQTPDGNKDLRHSYTQPPCYFVTNGETRSKTGSDGCSQWNPSECLWPRGPTKPPRAGEEGQENHGPVGDQLNPPGCYFVGLDHFKTKNVEESPASFVRVDEKTTLKKSEEHVTGEYGDSENGTQKKPPLAKDAPVKVPSTDRTGAEDDIGQKHDRSSAADVSTMEGVAQERKREAGSVKSADELQHQERKTLNTDLSPDGSIGGSLEGTRGTPGRREEQHYKSDYLQDPLTDNIQQELIALDFLSSDAVAPGLHVLGLGHGSETADNNPTALDCDDDFPPVSSAPSHHSSVLWGFDNFEKIPLSPDAHAGLDISLLMKSPSQLLSHSAPGVESDECEGKLERSECHAVNAPNGSSNSDGVCNGLVPAEEVTAPGPDCESAAESLLIQGDVKEDRRPAFEGRAQFDLVLKELNLYFDISRAESASGQPEVTDISEIHTSDGKEEELSGPELAHTPSGNTEQVMKSTVMSQVGLSCSHHQYVPRDT